MPISLMHCSTCFGSKLIFIPKAVRTSAEPELLDTPLFPCFATGMPAPAVTKAAVVEILNVGYRKGG